jgi:hypothetical protein
MTEQRLPELLGELAEPVAAVGLAERAWQRAQLIRRRRRASVGAVAAVTLTAGALTMVRSYGPGPGLGGQTDPAATGDPNPSASVSVSASASPAPRITPTPPAATIAGAPTWLSPRPEDERALPVLPSVLPARIDLTGTAPLLRDKPVPRAVAAYLLTTLDGELDRVLVLGNDSALRRVDLGDLKWVPDGQGNATAPFLRTSLSPDGKRIAFAQEHEIVVLTLADASWQRYPVRAVNTDFFQWFSDDMVFSGAGPAIDLRTGGISEVDYEPYPLGQEGFPVRSWWAAARRNGELVAQAGFTTGIDKPDAGTGSPEVVAVGGARRALLVMHAGDPTGADSRSKGCCDVISWLDGATVAFESGTRDQYVLAWNTRTGQLARVTQVVGPAGRSVGGSYADLTRL